MKLKNCIIVALYFYIEKLADDKIWFWSRKFIKWIDNITKIRVKRYQYIQYGLFFFSISEKIYWISKLSYLQSKLVFQIMIFVHSQLTIKKYSCIKKYFVL